LWKLCPSVSFFTPKSLEDRGHHGSVVLDEHVFFLESSAMKVVIPIHSSPYQLCCRSHGLCKLFVTLPQKSAMLSSYIFCWLIWMFDDVEVISCILESVEEMVIRDTPTHLPRQYACQQIRSRSRMAEEKGPTLCPVAILHCFCLWLENKEIFNW
jgi:hypothetical protein